jgi:hypothetical protein
MKRMVITVLAVLFLFAGAYFAYEYITDPKIVDGVVSKSLNNKGKPGEITTEFSKNDTIYFSAKANRFWIKKADVVWYKGEIATANRVLVENGIELNKAGYFTAELSVPEGLDKGHYSVTIYVDGKGIRETNAEFDIE